MKHPTHEALRRLRLYGMARGLEDLERQPERSQLSFDDQLALLVERETAERANTALASRLKRARLLFVAHREEILTQSLATFRQALSDWTFGELWVGGQRPRVFDHVFAEQTEELAVQKSGYGAYLETFEPAGGAQ